MYTLYYTPGVCSMAVHVALNETGADYKLSKVDIHAAVKDPEFLKINSRGNVPVLDDNGLIVREGAAILIHLLEKENSPLMPKSGPERARALEWLCWANSSLHPKYGMGFAARRVSDDAKTQEAVGKFAIAGIQKLWDDTEAHLAKNKYLAGESVTAADILMAVIANWSPMMPGTINFSPNVTRVLKDVTSRPSFKQALQSEGVEYKVAA